MGVRNIMRHIFVPEKAVAYLESEQVQDRLQNFVTDSNFWILERFAH
jgi:hypothetical protein